MNGERAIIVDEADTVIGYKDREELDIRDRYRVTGVWIEDGQGHVLIALRSKISKNHPGVWGDAAGGAVAEGESYEDNAYKELAEELGVQGVLLGEIGTRKVDNNNDGTRRYCTWYKAVINKPAEAFQPEDKIEQLVWADKSWVLQDVQDHPEHYLPSAQHWPDLFAD